MSTTPLISLEILPGASGAPPTVRACVYPDIGGDQNVKDTIMGNTDTALVARAGLSAMAYLFAQGQPVKFGPEIPLEALK